jgi:hypothetical protein
VSNEKWGIRHADGEVTGRYDSWLEAYRAIPQDDGGTIEASERIVRLSEESAT